MNSNSHSDPEPTEYPPLPDGLQDSPEWQAAQALHEHATLAQGRLALGCCMFSLSRGGYLLTGLPPMGDVCGHDTWMTIYTAEHLVRIEGRNLHLLARAMKMQKVDDVRATTEAEELGGATDWVITSITAQTRDDD